MKLRFKDQLLSLDRPLVMGVLNVTPDSFSDGGLWFEEGKAVDHGFEMIEQGAAIVDVGGESTRPGATAVGLDEEVRRVMPVVEKLAAAGVVVSIDTRKPEVASRAIAAGASIINDTAGEALDARMDEVARTSGAAIIVMHSRGTPATMRSLTEYSDVVGEVVDWLKERASSLESKGVRAESIALDPGIGFAKSPEQSLLLLQRLDEMADVGYPIVIGTSRKSFIGAVLDLPEDRRQEGTAATVAWAVAKGAHIVRVHDVAEMARVVRMTQAIKDAEST
ncbi:MAG: dihydropteroate synthase [Actinomycetota bacterium]